VRAATMSEKLLLTPQLFVAEGTDRKCYRHPDRNECCVKVLHPEVGPGRFWREVKYFSRLRRRGIDFKHLSAYRGIVDTNLGKGAMFDLVLDDDSRISRSLHHYLGENDLRFNAWVGEEMERLKQDLYTQWIAIHDLNPTNILVKRLGFDEFRMVVIDGVGHNHFVPLASYSPAFARRKLVRAWNRRYRQWYSAFPAVLNQLKPYSTI
jgi:hypothetical protein